MPFCYDHGMDELTKTCTKCDETKPLDDFYAGTGKLGVKASCKRCHNDAIIAKQRTPEGKVMQMVKRLKHRYGITLDQYNWLLEEQDHKCFLCGEDERIPHWASGEPMKLAVDHDHRCCPGTKKGCGKCVRGLLCSNCNRFMGRVDRSPRLAARFRDYQDRRPLEEFYEEDESVEDSIDTSEDMFEGFMDYYRPPIRPSIHSHVAVRTFDLPEENTDGQ